MAATAAGMGALASAPSAEAKIVYTPAHEKISENMVSLDLNHDGVTDFTLMGDFFMPGVEMRGIRERCSRGERGQQNMGSPGDKTSLQSSLAASALPAGVIIGAKGFGAQPAGQQMLGQFISIIGTGNGTYKGYYTVHGPTAAKASPPVSRD
jgi:hypothetical protein